MNFEGEDLTFYEALTAALTEEVREKHADHVIRILESSSRSSLWAEETTLLRLGMRKSLDPDLRDPAKAARTVVDLVATLEAFRLQGDRMEEWFFVVLDGVATDPDALIAFSTYAALTELPKMEIATARATTAPPAGSGESEFGDERDPALDLDESESESEFEVAGTRIESAECLSTGEVYYD